MERLLHSTVRFPPSLTAGWDLSQTPFLKTWGFLCSGGCWTGSRGKQSPCLLFWKSRWEGRGLTMGAPCSRHRATELSARCWGQEAGGGSVLSMSVSVSVTKAAPCGRWAVRNERELGPCGRVEAVRAGGGGAEMLRNGGTVSQKRGQMWPTLRTPGAQSPDVTSRPPPSPPPLAVSPSAPLGGAGHTGLREESWVQSARQPR